MPTKVHLVKAMVFPGVMYGCKSWTIRKAERQRIDAFELWCWRRLLRVPWTARRSNQFILGEISPGCSLEGLMLKLKLQYFGHLIWRADSLEKNAGKDWGQEKKGMTEDETVGWHHWLDGHECGWTPGVGDGQGGLPCCSSQGRKESDTTEWLNWTELLYNILVVFAIHSHESAMVVLVHVFPIPLPSPSHPSWSSPCTSPKYPISCIKPELAIYFTYGNIHVSMLFSQIIPPSPSPTESKSLFFTPVQWPSF